jgi:hypothetical protein
LNALEYAQERVQGADLTEASDKTAPRVPIIAHPDVRRSLMNQKAHAEGLRALVSYTAWVQDQVELHPEDDTWTRRSFFLLPLVKGYSSEKAYELLGDALTIFGGSGYTQDYPIEQYIRDAKIDTVYEGTTGIQAMDLFFRQIARDQGTAFASISSEIVEFVKGGEGEDELAPQRELLGEMMDDVQEHLGVMVEHLLASVDEKEEVYKVGLHATPLLESMAELVVAWQLLSHAEVALPKVDEEPFYRGKVESALWFTDHVAPKVKARAELAVAEDGHLMGLPVAAF